jgi:hypothetical protein
VPALAVGGAVHSVTHPAQVASLLGLAPARRDDVLRVAWDLHRVLEAWLELARTSEWAAWSEGTPSAGRTPLQLVVNSFVPIRPLADAWWSGEFLWGTLDWPPPEGIVVHEAALTARHAERASLVDYADAIREAWSEFLRETEQELRSDADRPIAVARGEPLPYAQLVESQLVHAAQHYRQVVTQLAATNRPVPPFDPEQLAVRLPEQIY